MNGPFILVDKSTIQSFTLDEVITLNRFFSVVICPTLIREICANLRSYEQYPEETKNKIAYLAKKTNGMGAFTIGAYQQICSADLLGAKIPLDATIPRFDGKEVIDKYGKKGIVFTETPEEKNLARWQYKIFDKSDFETAELHDSLIRNYDLDGSSNDMGKLFPENKVFKSLEDILMIIDRFNETYQEQWPIIDSIAKAIGLVDNIREIIKKRWLSIGKPQFSKFAPYAFYCCRLLSAFWIGVTSKLIPTSPNAKAAVDYEYLFYFPFCHVFSSGDKFHGRLATLLKRNNQYFVKAEALKNDLFQIAKCLENMSEIDRKYYQDNFGIYPPPVINSITSTIWNDFMIPREQWVKGSQKKMTKEEEKKFLENIQFIMKSAKNETD